MAIEEDADEIDYTAALAIATEDKESVACEVGTDVSRQ